MADNLKTQAKGDYRVEPHPLLYSQPRGYRAPPPILLEQTLHGEGMDRVKLDIRGDNLYIACFENTVGKSFCFSQDQYNSYADPNAHILPFGSKYDDLVGDGQGGEAWKNLVGLDLSKPAINRAIKVAGTYDISKTTEAEITALKWALATLAVFVCESTRFPYIRQLVERAFDGEDIPVQGIIKELDHRGAQLVVQWKRISCAILIWYYVDKKKKWNSVEAGELALERPYGPGIATVEEALATVGPILRAKGCSVDYYIQ